MSRAAILLLVAWSLLVLGCEALFPPPVRPRRDGYRAVVKTEVAGKTLRVAVVVTQERQRRDFGNPGARRSLILRRDLGEAWELDEARQSARVRPLLEGETLVPFLGGYPLVPVSIAELDLEFLAGRYPGWEINTVRLSDALVGFHPCDVLRVDRFRPDGSGYSESWSLARDLDGLVIRREVRSVSEGEFGPWLEFSVLAEIELGAAADLFEIPEGWTVERSDQAEDRSRSLPPGALVTSEVLGLAAEGTEPGEHAAVAGEPGASLEGGP